MADVMVTIGASLGELKQHLDQAGALVKGFKEQASKAKEAAGFLSQAISSIGGESSKAASLASNLVGGFAMGGPMGLAIGGVNALIGAFKDLQKQEEEATKRGVEYLKTLTDIRDKALANTKSSMDQLALERAKTPLERYDVETEQGKRDREKALRQAIEAQKAGPDMSKLGEGQWESARIALQQDVTAARAELKAYEALRKEQREEAEKKAAEAAAKREAELIRLRQAQDQFVAGLEREAEILGRQATNDAVKKGKEAEKGSVLGEAPAFAGRGVETNFDEPEGFKKLAQDAAIYQRRLQEIQASTRDFMELAGPVANAFGQTFANIGKGTQGMSAIWKSAAQEIMQVLYQMAVKSIMSHAAGAAAGAAESQAGIPIVGPAMAVAAMTAMYAMVSGLLSNIPARQFGGDVFAGQPYLVGEVGPELFVPQGSGSIVPNDRIAAGGGNTFVIQALDSKSFEDALNRQEDALVRKLDDLARNRRI